MENASNLQTAGEYEKNTIRVINSKDETNAETSEVTIPEGKEIELN